MNNDTRLYTQEQRLGYILRGKNRRKIYSALIDSQKTPSEISLLTNIPTSNVSRVLKQFLDHFFVRKSVSTPQQCTFYALTPVALEFQEEFLRHMKFKELIKSKQNFGNGKLM